MELSVSDQYTHPVRGSTAMLVGILMVLCLPGRSARPVPSMRALSTFGSEVSKSVQYMNLCVHVVCLCVCVCAWACVRGRVCAWACVCVCVRGKE